MRKIRKKSLFYVIILSLTVVGVGVYFSLKTLNSYNVQNTGVKQDTLYYSLRNNATDYQKEIYDELVVSMKAESHDDEVISQLIAQNYVADFYTWTNKVRFNDITALQYIHQDIRNAVYNQATDTFYNDMDYYLNQNTVTQTLEVISSEATSTPTIYEMDEETIVDAYEVMVVWQYAPSTLVDITAYQTESTFIVIKDADGLYSIVEAYHGQE